MRQTSPHQGQILPTLEVGLIVLLLGQQQKESTLEKSQRGPSLRRVAAVSGEQGEGEGPADTADGPARIQDFLTGVFLTFHPLQFGEWRGL